MTEASHAGGTVVDVDRYLARIGYTGDPIPTASVLAALQLAHMIAVPFENLDVVARRPVSTEVAWSYPKVVDAGRGGWCFELNGSFGALLEALGFRVAYHSARVWDAAAKELGPELDHLCLLVEAAGDRWLVDVGFGDSALTPLRFDTGDVQERRPRRCRLDRTGDEVEYLEWMPSNDWELQYTVDLAPRTLGDFQARSDALASGAGGGYFTEKPFATRALSGDGSRVWLLKDRLKRAEGSRHEQVETPVDESAWDVMLREWFGMSRPEPAKPVPAGGSDR